MGLTTTVRFRIWATTRSVENQLLLLSCATKSPLTSGDPMNEGLPEGLIIKSSAQVLQSLPLLSKSIFFLSLPIFPAFFQNFTAFFVFFSEPSLPSHDMPKA